LTKAIYIEYISRRPGVPLDAFHAIAGPGQEGWAEAYSDDTLILNIGRTWRLGAEPEYLAVWQTQVSAGKRLGEWAGIFGTGEADYLEVPFTAGRIDVAGIYEPLLEPIAAHGGTLYYGEYFDFTPGACRDDVARFYRERAASQPQRVLNLVADRIGRLGPDPRGVAFWQLLSYEELDGIAVELGDVTEPVRLVRAGLYADIGKEVL
jgi:hypothetical protein